MPDPTAIEQSVLAIARRAYDAVNPPRPTVEEIRARQQRIDRERQQRAAQAQIREIPTRYATPAPLLPAVEAWAEDVHTGATGSLLLLGTVGTGKTHQAFTAYASLLNAGHGAGRARWASCPDLLESLRPGRDGDLRPYIDAPLLLLDDLAAQRDTEWTLEQLYRLLDARYAWCRPTIVTTNSTPEQLAERLGERIASRLAGMAVLVPMVGDDRRLQQ